MDVAGALSGGARGALEAYVGLLREVAAPRGWVGPGDVGRLFERHVTDSLRAVRVLRAEDREAVDAGSGAGLPGVPVAIARPDVSVRLVEARRGRAAFLELVVERLRLPNVEVLPTRVEDLDISVDVVFARAFAPAAVAWSRLSRLLRPGGHLVYFAGDRSEDLDVVGPASLERVDDAVLATSGPLIIMTR